MSPVQVRAAKVQRWIDLMAALLVRRTPATFEELAARVPAYATGKRESVLRTFERDKEELRRFGVPIETVPIDDGEGAAYRLSGRSFYLPYLNVARVRTVETPGAVPPYGYRSLDSLAFESDELVVIAEAARRVRALADPAIVADVESAIAKLALDLPLVEEKRAMVMENLAALDQQFAESDADLDVEREPAELDSGEEPVRPGSAPMPSSAAPRVAASSFSRSELSPPSVAAPLPDAGGAPADPFLVLSDALARRKLVALEETLTDRYRFRGRVMEPFGLAFFEGTWQLTARDVDTGAVDDLPLDRIHHASVNTRRPDTADYAIPPSFDLRGRITPDAAPVPRQRDDEALVEFREWTELTRAAATHGRDVAAAPSRRAFAIGDRVAFARWLLSFGGDAVAISPPSLIAELERQASGARSLYDAEAESG